MRNRVWFPLIPPRRFMILCPSEWERIGMMSDCGHCVGVTWAINGIAICDYSFAALPTKISGHINRCTEFNQKFKDKRNQKTVLYSNQTRQAPVIQSANQYFIWSKIPRATFILFHLGSIDFFFFGCCWTFFAGVIPDFHSLLIRKDLFFLSLTCPNVQYCRVHWIVKWILYSKSVCLYSVL